MSPPQLKPTKTEHIAVSIYAGGTAILYTEAIHNLLLSPLFSYLINYFAPDMPETNKSTISTCASYCLLFPFFIILSKTQYSSNCRAIEAYNQQTQVETEEESLLHPDVKKHHAHHIIPTMSATCKSTATGLSAWSMFSKIPVVGKFVGAAAGIITFGGSFFTQRKFLGLKPITVDSESATSGSGESTSDYGVSEHPTSILP